MPRRIDLTGWRLEIMSDIWQGNGLWAGWRLTTDHHLSSYGMPVLVDPAGNAYGPNDIGERVYQADLARELGVSRAAITGRIKRGTLPPYDGRDRMGREYWMRRNLQHIIGK